MELFAGIGGFRAALESTGKFQCVYSNDIDPKCKKIYDLNFSEPNLHISDIYDVDPHDLPAVDLIVAGFPCQAFSIAGKQEGFADQRGQVFFRLAEFIKVLQPSMILLENVKNLRGHQKGKTFATVKQTLNDLGYHLHFEVLNTMVHTDLPQNRERLFVVGFKDNRAFVKFGFPEPATARQSFRALLEPSVDPAFFYTERFPMYDKLVTEMTNADAVYQWRRYIVRENKKNVVPTLTHNMGTGGHNVPLILDDGRVRKLTPHECFRLQGFPDSYKFPADSGNSRLYGQIGNSVTVPLIARIAKEMLRALE